MERFRLKRNEIQEFQRIAASMETKLSEITNREGYNIQNLQLLEAKDGCVSKELTCQREKRDRAVKLVEKNLKLLRTKEGTFPRPTSEEFDFLIRNLRDLGTMALTEINKLSVKEPHLESNIQTIMSRLGLSPPSRAVSRVSSRASSVKDNMSSTSSRSNSRANSQRDIAGKMRDILPPSNSKSVSVVNLGVIPMPITLSTQKLDKPSRSSSRASSGSQKSHHRSESAESAASSRK